MTKENIEYYKEFLAVLQGFGWNPVVESNLKSLLVKKVGLSESTDEFNSHKDFKSGIDLSFSIGGDGTFIENVKSPFVLQTMHSSLEPVRSPNDALLY